MIFVTVGAGAVRGFDPLIKAVDNLNLKEKVICQIGNGNYIPKNCEYFRIKPSIIHYFKKADIIISAGGAGSTFELLNLGKKIISVVNPDVAGDHQKELINRLNKENYLIWCKNLNQFNEHLNKAKKFKFKKYKKSECRIYKIIEMNIL